MSSSIIRDRETGFSNIYYSLPFRKIDYFLGKFLSGFLVSILLFSAIPIGIWMASHMPWLNDNQIADFQLLHYLQPICLWMIPNLFFLSSLFFAMTCLSRTAQLTYISGVLCYAVYLISYFSISRFTDFSVAAILDPFAILTEEFVTNYWTVEQQNTLLVSPQGAVLYNRLIYSAIGLSLLAFAYYRFQLKSTEGSASNRKTASLSAIADDDLVELLPASTNSSVLLWKQLIFRSFMEFRMTIANRFFLVILFATFIMLLLSSGSLYAMFGVSITKFTAAMIEAKEGPFPLFVLLVLVIYSGDLIHRDSKHKFTGLNDTLPVPSWLFLSSKLLNLLYITLLMFSTIIISGIIIQLFNGHYLLEIGLYLVDNFCFSLPIYFFFAIMIFFLHVIAPNEYVGHALVLLFWISRGALISMGYEHHLLLFGRLPEHFYSEINGFFPFSQTTFLVLYLLAICFPTLHEHCFTDMETW